MMIFSILLKVDYDLILNCIEQQQLENKVFFQFFVMNKLKYGSLLYFNPNGQNI
jgi:hypothetical protein